MDKNVTNFTDRKNGGHFEKWAAIGRRYMPHHSYTSRSKEVPACVRFSALFRLLAQKNI